MRTTQRQDTKLSDQILDWVRDNVDVDGLYGEEIIKQYVRDFCVPDDVFPGKELEDWAFGNGFRKFE